MRNLFGGKVAVALVTGVLAAILMTSGVSARSDERSGEVGNGYRTVSIYVDGRKTGTGSCYLKGGTTLVPFRALCNVLGEGEVSWDGANMTANYKSRDLAISAKIGSNYIVANGRYFYHDEAVVLIGGSTYLPVRTLAKAFCANVLWDGATLSAKLETTGEKLASGDEFYDQNDLIWLSRLIHCEARGEPERGRIAVGNVVLNRVASEDFPNTVYGVIFDNRYNTVQFYPVGSPAIRVTPDENSVIAAKICLEGYTVSDRILYYLNPRTATNTWTVRNRPFVMRIQNHDFYA